MFKELKRKFILTNLLTTTVVLILAGVAIFALASWRQEMRGPVPPEMSEESERNEELERQLQRERRESLTDLLVILISVGLVLELVVFSISYHMAEKTVRPVEEAYKKQRIFIANASHELKTPMAVIQANFEALDLGEDAEPWAGNIETEITHANKLVLDLLNLAKLDVGKGTQKMVDVNLKEIVEERVKMFAPKFAGKIKIVGDDVNLKVVEQDLKQVLDILLDNAVKYGDKKVRIELSDKGLKVENDGVKIADEDLNKIFDRFYQTDKTKEGSGLGLAIAKAVCEKNGWKISAKNNGALTRFEMSF